MLKMIKYYKDTENEDIETFVVTVLIDWRTYVKEFIINMPIVRSEQGVRENWADVTSQIPTISSSAEWVKFRRRDGFGLYEDYNPWMRKRRRRARKSKSSDSEPRNLDKPTKKERMKQKMAEFKKSLIKRKDKKDKNPSGG